MDYALCLQTKTMLMVCYNDQMTTNSRWRWINWSISETNMQQSVKWIRVDTQLFVRWSDDRWTQRGLWSSRNRIAGKACSVCFDCMPYDWLGRASFRQWFSEEDYFHLQLWSQHSIGQSFWNWEIKRVVSFCAPSTKRYFVYYLPHACLVLSFFPVVS